jgi:hypothetical protein
MFDNVLVGVDGRPGGRDALVLARQLAAPAARLTLANIYGEAGWPPGSARPICWSSDPRTAVSLARC